MRSLFASRFVAVPGTGVGLLAALVATLTIAGCSQSPEPKFVFGESTGKLYRPAQKAVEMELMKDFGEPNHIVV
ncbi:MAG TPA: hypothetical protein VG125_15795, partial [Pirellulales bacterium]|nr:hypothetical protein [Pirellulales bacterium]